MIQLLDLSSEHQLIVNAAAADETKDPMVRIILNNSQIFLAR